MEYDHGKRIVATVGRANKSPFGTVTVALPSVACPAVVAVRRRTGIGGAFATRASSSVVLMKTVRYETERHWAAAELVLRSTRLPDEISMTTCWDDRS